MILRGSVFSKVLEMDTGITVAAPNDFRPGGGYKVCYLLHGLSGSNVQWSEYSLLGVHASRGKTIYVMPEAARSFYTDMKFGLKYFTYVAEELPSVCESVFRISAAREDTVVMGESVGGYGALKCALTYPEKYGACAAFSAACLFLAEGMAFQRAHPERVAETFGQRLADDFAAAFGPDLVCGRGIDLLQLAHDIPAASPKPRLSLCCGLEDGFLADNRRFAGEMKQSGFDVAYDEWEGGHDFFFFGEGLKRAIDLFGL